MIHPDTLPPLELDPELDLASLERAVKLTPRERLDRVGDRLRSALRTRALDVTIVTLLLVLATVIHLPGMYDSPARFDDEGTYTAYAWAVQYLGKLGHYTYWYAHPPIGWIQMAGWNWLTDAFNRAPYAVAAERQFMVVCKLVSVALLYVLALRLRMTRFFAVLAVLLFVLSPLATYFTRAALLDNIVTPWLLAAFVLAASRRQSLRAAAGAGFCFAIAVLTKETALLFLPALLLLFFQCTDRRNRAFSTTMFAAALVLVGGMYPLYAVVKNELFEGPGHVSIEWAVKWQLFDRQGSGSIFDAHSNAHAVVASWLSADGYLPWLSLFALPVALLLRRSRAVGIAFGIQVAELFRSGYLPYPFVVAMIPFGALVVAGALDGLWQVGRIWLPAPVRDLRWTRRLFAYDFESRSVLLRRGPGRVRRAVRRALGPSRVTPSWVARLRSLTGAVVPWTLRVGVLAVVLGFVALAASPWKQGTLDQWHNDRDAGMKAALTWVEGNTSASQRVVVDDAMWVDLVRSGHPSNHVIWFTKLDVDKDVVLPSHPQWKSINYVALGAQDELSVHLNADGTPSPSTLTLFPTLGRALAHGQQVAHFGIGLDAVTIWRVDPLKQLPSDKKAAAARAAADAAKAAAARPPAAAPSSATPTTAVPATPQQPTATSPPR